MVAEAYVEQVPVSWRERAACFGMSLIPGNEELFFVQGRGSTTKRCATAVALCASCEVRAECLDYAVSLPLSAVAGVWAGLGIRGIRKERQRRGLPAEGAPGCGSNAGYYRHMRACEPACAECRLAHAEYTLTRRHTTAGGPASSTFEATRKAQHTRWHGTPRRDCSYCDQAQGL